MRVHQLVATPVHHPVTDSSRVGWTRQKPLASKAENKDHLGLCGRSVPGSLRQWGPGDEVPSRRCPVGLTQVNICEALRGDGVSRIFVNVLQAQAGKLWFVEEPGLQGTAAHQHPAPKQDPRQIPWFKICHEFEVLGPWCLHMPAQGPGDFPHS